MSCDRYAKHSFIFKEDPAILGMVWLAKCSPVKFSRTFSNLCFRLKWIAIANSFDLIVDWDRFIPARPSVWPLFTVNPNKFSVYIIHLWWPVDGWSLTEFDEMEISDYFKSETKSSAMRSATPTITLNESSKYAVPSILSNFDNPWVFCAIILIVDNVYLRANKGLWTLLSQFLAKRVWFAGSGCCFFSVM